MSDFLILCRSCSLMRPSYIEQRGYILRKGIFNERGIYRKNNRQQPHKYVKKRS
jgi:hypothetical protein